MPRPRKWRRVCRLPQNTLFGPLAGIDDGTIVMTVEEYETIRLIDLEGLNQEACAERMHVARPPRKPCTGTRVIKLPTASSTADG
ncbi:MAG: DUF134 domain-containing protein [Bilophila wadsworthia]